MKNVKTVRLLFCLLCLSAARIGLPADVTPLIQAHAHNDYEHTRPLLDALDNGFCSVEADIYLVDGALLVAHERANVRPERTLQALYLDPLRARAKKNGGRIYASGPVSITLLIDLKTSAETTYPVLRRVLEQYTDILTEFDPRQSKPRAVTVILSGARPPIDALAAEKKRWAAFDGRLSDLETVSVVSPNVMPLVSESWSKISAWKAEPGTALPDADRRRVEEIVRKAHQRGYRLRFWATPDTPAAWKAMRDLHVDLINTDDLPGLSRFLAAKSAEPEKP